MRKVKKTSFTSENQPKKAKGGKRGPGRPPKPKDPTLLQRIYDGIDHRIDKHGFEIIDKVLRAGKKKDACRWEIELAARMVSDLLDKRLPRKLDHELEGGLTIIVENPIPGMKPGVRKYEKH